MNRPQTADGTLVIMVCRAKHLPNRRKLDKQCPYALLRIGTAAQKTPSDFRAGQTPEWTHECRFTLTRERKPTMKLDVLDETKNDPTPVGNTEIDCSQVFLDPAHLQEGGKYILDAWHDLQFNGRPAGKIYLEMTFYPSAPIPPPKMGFEEISNQNGLDHYHNRENPDNRPYSAHEDMSDMRNSLPTRTLAADDVFVTEDARGRFRRSDPGVPATVVPEGVFSSGKKEPGRFSKLKSRFRALESKWETRNRPMPEEGVPQLHPEPLFPQSVSPLPYSEPTDTTGDTPPPPPPHVSQSPTRPHLAPLGRTETLPYYARSPVQLLPNRSPERRSPERRSPEKHGSPTRKPPPGLSTTSVPFSADSFGAEDDALPTAVYSLGKPVQQLTHPDKTGAPHTLNPHEIDPRFYAPTPLEHMGPTQDVRKREGRRDLDSGYLGEGRWKVDRFSPSVFQRIGDENEKPAVPPKIPPGLSEKEYYTLERDSYLKDVNGRRL